MKKFSWSELNWMTQHLLIPAISELKVEDMPRTESGDLILDIQLTVNGVDFSDAFNILGEKMAKQYEHVVQSRAIEIVDAKYGELITKIEHARDAFTFEDN